MNTYSKNYTKKISSGILLLLLVASPLFAVISLSPVVHATTAGTITLSQTSGDPYWLPADTATFGPTTYFGSFVTITGTGFPSGQDNGGIDFCFVPTSVVVSLGCASGLDLTTDPSGPWTLIPTIASATGPAGTVAADANGYFQVSFYVPTVAGGTYNLYAVYTPIGGSKVMTSPVVFTVNTSVHVVDQSFLTSSGQYLDTYDILLLGFAAPGGVGEHVQMIPSTFFGTLSTQVGGTAGTNQGATEVDGAGPIGTAAGASDMPGGAQLLQALGLSSGRVAKTSFTITPSIEVFTYAAACAGVNPALSIAPNAGQKVCIAGHGFAADKTIAAASVTIGGTATITGTIYTNSLTGAFPSTAVTLQGPAPVGQLTVVVNGTSFNFDNGNMLGYGVLLGSANGGGQLTQIEDATTGTTSGHVGQTIFVFGFGYAAAAVSPTFNAFPQANLWPTTQIVFAPTVALHNDANGAFLAYGTIPHVPYVKNGYSIIDNTAAAPTQTFTVTPRVSFQYTNVGYTTTSTTKYFSFGDQPYLTGNGFLSGETMTVTIESGPSQVSSTWPPTAPISVTAAGDLAFQLSALGATPTPDLAMGSYKVNMSGITSGNWATSRNSAFVLPIADANTFNVVGGNAGTTLVLQTTTTGGLHGLAPNTLYSVMWDTTIQMTTFTSTATGQVPIGTQFVVPAGTSGNHIVDIQSGGSSVIYGDLLSGGSQFLNLVFALGTSLTATPSAVGAGSTVTATGNGLPANTELYIQLSGVTYAQFTSTASGSVPSDVTFTFPTIPNPGDELGQLVAFNICNGTGNCAIGILNVVYIATMTLSSTVGPAGSTVTATASGLDAFAQYNIVFNYAATAASAGYLYTGTVVGAILTTALGTGTATFQIPSSAATGTYTVSLVSVSGWWLPFYGILTTPPTFTIGVPTGVGDTSLTPGTPTSTTVAGNPALSITYTNTLSTSITAFSFAVVTNSLGQIVYYTTASLSLSAGATGTAYLVLAGLPSGTYTVSIYAISSNNIVVSTTTSASVTI